MSGGAYNYAHSRVSSFAEELRQLADDIDPSESRPEGSDRWPWAEPATREAFREYLRRISEILDGIAPVLRAIEWNDDGDCYPEGEEERLILGCLPPELLPKEGSGDDLRD